MLIMLFSLPPLFLLPISPQQRESGASDDECDEKEKEALATLALAVSKVPPAVKDKYAQYAQMVRLGMNLCTTRTSFHPADDEI